MNQKTNVIYTALFVNDQKSLLGLFEPVHKNVFAHHMTIAFRPKNGLDGIEVGKSHQLKIIGRVVDGSGDALLVESNRSENDMPHITVSTAVKVPPTYSNEMLESAEKEHLIEYFNEPTIISVTEGYFDGQNKILE